MHDDGTFLEHPALAPLPTLVRRQRRLEAQIAPRSEVLEPLLEKEKQVRQQIDALLVQAGIGNAEGVTCNGYDVKHYRRDGQARINADTVIAQLVAAGVDRTLVETVLADATERSPEVLFATVKPMKGARVRKSRAAA